MLSATALNEDRSIEKIDCAFVKDEYKYEIATTADADRAISNNVVYDEL